MLIIESLTPKLLSRFDPQAAKGLDVVYQFEISEQSMHLLISPLGPELRAGKHKTPDIRIETTEDILMGVISGKTNAMNAFFTGKIKARGDLNLAHRLKSLFGKQSVPA